MVLNNNVPVNKKNVQEKSEKDSVDFREALVLPTKERQIREQIVREEELMSKILVVDDNPQAILMYEKFLRSKKYQVLTAVNGEQAILTVKTAEVHIVILDHKLPDMSGLDVLRQIREHDKGMQVLFVTADDTVEVIEEAAKIGISSYLVKPVKLDLLAQRIQVALNKTFNVEPPPLVEPF